MIVEGLENSDDNLLDKVAYIEVEAYNLYNNYALQTGFSVWKGKPRYFNWTKNIRQREFLSSKEGFKIDEDPCEDKNWKKLETKTTVKHLFVSQLKMMCGGLLHLIQSIIINLHYH